jgi:hypothetical protein
MFKKPDYKMKEPKVVMLQHDLKGFYISSLELEDLKSMCCFDKKMIQTIKVLNDDFDEVIDLREINIVPSTLGAYITSVRLELSPKDIMVFSLKFEDDTFLHFQTGELSLFASDPDLIEKTAIGLLNQSGFNGKYIFKKLKSNKQFYIAISEDSEFEYLYPHPLNEDENTI